MSRTKHERKVARRTQAANRKPDLPRAPSGALSRSAFRYEREAELTKAEQTENMAVVVQARVRTGKASIAAAAASVEAGSSIGRLLMAGKIGRRLYEAGTRFGEDVYRWHRLIGLPHPSPRAINYARVGGEAACASRDEVREAETRYMAIYRAIAMTGSNHAQVRVTLWNCVVEDFDAANWNEYTVGLLRRGLVALADLYGLPADGAFDSLDNLRRRSA